MSPSGQAGWLAGWMDGWIMRDHVMDLDKSLKPQASSLKSQVSCLQSPVSSLVRMGRSLCRPWQCSLSDKLDFSLAEYSSTTQWWGGSSESRCGPWHTGSRNCPPSSSVHTTREEEQQQQQQQQQQSPALSRTSNPFQILNSNH